jgi:hypothetical protein
MKTEKTTLLLGWRVYGVGVAAIGLACLWRLRPWADRAQELSRSHRLGVCLRCVYGRRSVGHGMARRVEPSSVKGIEVLLANLMPSCGRSRLRRTKTATPMLWLSGLVLLATLASSSQVTSSTAEIPDLNLILQRMEDILHRDPAQSLPYEVTREYKVFRGYDHGAALLRPTREKRKPKRAWVTTSPC